MPHIEWSNIQRLESRQYTCGYCGNSLITAEGYSGYIQSNLYAHVYICHFCSSPTFIDEKGKQYPGPVFGKAIEDLPENINNLYDEARNCISCNAYTASVMCSRKLLMNVAVFKGAKEGQNFSFYVGWLIDNGYIPVSAKDWVDHIRQVGNEANHEISIKSREEAEQLIIFIENILESIFEFPAKLQKRQTK